MAREVALFDQSGNRKYLNTAERKMYFEAIDDKLNLAQQAFCLTLFYTGCRISEGLCLTRERVDLRGKALVFETLKRRRRGHFRSIPIPDNLTKMMRQVLAESGLSLRVWTFSRPTAYRMVRDRMAKAGISGAMACPKGLRHGFAVACIEQNIPITTVQKWLGHARLETTAIYLEISGHEERNYAKRLWSSK
jgi:site-specific recombinase XerD